MKRKVIINRLPQADSGLSVKMNNLRAGLGFNANKMPWSVMAGQMSEPDVSVKKQLGPVPREFANLEAEKGETAMIPNKDGIPSTYTIGGKRHSQGGTPLNLPKDSLAVPCASFSAYCLSIILRAMAIPRAISGFCAWI